MGCECRVGGGCCAGSEGSWIVDSMVDGGSVVGEAERAIERIGVGAVFFAGRGIGGEGLAVAWVRWVFVIVTEMGRGGFRVLGVIAAMAAVGGGFG